MDVFPSVLEECISPVLEKTLAVFETRRGELIAVANKMLSKLYARYDINKVVK